MIISGNSDLISYIMKTIIIFLIDPDRQNRDAERVVVRICNEDSPDMEEQCRNSEAKAAGVKLESVEVIDAFNLAEWAGTDPDRRAFLQKLSSLDSSQNSSNPLSDLLSFMATRVYRFGYGAGYEVR